MFTPTFVESIAERVLPAINGARLFAIFGRWRIRDVFDDWLEGIPKSSTLKLIYSQVYGEDYAEEAAPSSFVSLSDLRRIAEMLDLGEEDVFADLACGRGGPGLWIARQTGASVIGIDFSEQGVQQAALRVDDFGLRGRARFQKADFSNTGLADASVDGVVCLDALWAAYNRSAVILEAARILRPSGHLVVTNWEGNQATLIRDHRRLLSDNGFDVLAYESIRDWKQRMWLVGQGILANRDKLIKEMGPRAAKVVINEAESMDPKKMCLIRHVIIAGAKKKPKNAGARANVMRNPKRQRPETRRKQILAPLPRCVRCAHSAYFE
jgi:ubiquinone/menaquinone biosynthesis C-methylase UbiE